MINLFVMNVRMSSFLETQQILLYVHLSLLCLKNSGYKIVVNMSSINKLRDTIVLAVRVVGFCQTATAQKMNVLQDTFYSSRKFKKLLMEIHTLEWNWKTTKYVSRCREQIKIAKELHLTFSSKVKIISQLIMHVQSVKLTH